MFINPAEVMLFLTGADSAPRKAPMGYRIDEADSR